MHLEALCAYINDEVEPRLHNAVSGVKSGELVSRREATLNTITRRDFISFFRGCKSAKSSANQEWSGLCSPYEIEKATVPTPALELRFAGQQARRMPQWSDHAASTRTGKLAGTVFTGKSEPRQASLAISTNGSR